MISMQLYTSNVAVVTLNINHKENTHSIYFNTMVVAIEIGIFELLIKYYVNEIVYQTMVIWYMTKQTNHAIRDKEHIVCPVLYVEHPNINNIFSGIHIL